MLVIKAEEAKTQIIRNEISASNWNRPFPSQTLLVDDSTAAKKKPVILLPTSVGLSRSCILPSKLTPKLLDKPHHPDKPPLWSGQWTLDLTQKVSKRKICEQMGERRAEKWGEGGGAENHDS